LQTPRSGKDKKNGAAVYFGLPAGVESPLVADWLAITTVVERT